jgi:hypothetical protein
MIDLNANVDGLGSFAVKIAPCCAKKPSSEMGRCELSGGPMMGVGSDERRQAIGADKPGSVRIGAAAMRMVHRGDEIPSDAGVSVEANPVLPQSDAPTRFGAILADARRHGLGQLGPAVA